MLILKKTKQSFVHYMTEFLGRILNQDILNPTNPANILVNKGEQITPSIIKLLKQYNITKSLYVHL